MQEPATHTANHARISHVWWFIAAAVLLFVVFIVNGATVAVTGSAASANPLPLNILISFVVACAALGAGIGANVSAFLNPVSPFSTKIISPLIIIGLSVVIIPFFVAIGLAMVG